MFYVQYQAKTVKQTSAVMIYAAICVPKKKKILRYYCIMLMVIISRELKRLTHEIEMGFR
jgi:hypothetical protein